MPTLLHKVLRWFRANSQESLRFKAGSVFVWWVLVSLLAISFVGHHPIVTMSIAILGGASIGVLAVLGMGD